MYFAGFIKSSKYFQPHIVLHNFWEDSFHLLHLVYHAIILGISYFTCQDDSGFSLCMSKRFPEIISFMFPRFFINELKLKSNLNGLSKKTQRMTCFPLPFSSQASSQSMFYTPIHNAQGVSQKKLCSRECVKSYMTLLLGI